LGAPSAVPTLDSCGNNPDRYARKIERHFGGDMEKLCAHLAELPAQEQKAVIDGSETLRDFLDIRNLNEIRKKLSFSASSPRIADSAAPAALVLAATRSTKDTRVLRSLLRLEEVLKTHPPGPLANQDYQQRVGTALGQLLQDLPQLPTEAARQKAVELIEKYHSSLDFEARRKIVSLAGNAKESPGIGDELKTRLRKLNDHEVRPHLGDLLKMDGWPQGRHIDNRGKAGFAAILKKSAVAPPENETAGPSRNTQDETKKSLLGLAIRPEVAEKHMNSIEFDGIGRICGFKENLSLTELNELQSAVITPLTQTNTTDERANARPGRDCMIQFMHLMENVKGEVAQKLLKDAKNQWMSGKLNNGPVSNFFTRAAEKLEGTPPLQSMVMALSKAIDMEKELTQHNDNMYGRRFESEFVQALIKNPPPATIDATRKIGQALFADFGKVHQLDDPGTSETLKKLAASMPPRPWFSEVPDVKKFKEEPTYENLKAMLLNVNHAFDLLKVQYLVAKISPYFSGGAPWKTLSDSRYSAILQLRAPRGANLEINTSGYGINLANHPDYEKYDTFESATNMAHLRKIPQMKKAAKAVRERIRHGHPTVGGISGSTHLLQHLSLQIASTDNEFSVEQAIVAGMMFFVFDGGHAINEIMAVYTALTALTSSENPLEDLMRSKEVKEKIDATEKKTFGERSPAKQSKRAC